MCSTLGILGAGQLGKMLAQAASQFGITSIFLDPAAEACASSQGNVLQAAFHDEHALKQLQQQCLQITYEFENIPVETAQYFESNHTVAPGSAILKVSQDRLYEKEFLNQLDIPTAPFFAFEHADALPKAIEQVGLPCIIKTRRLGYDGKGQWCIRDVSQLQSIQNQLTQGPFIAEGFVSFEEEISIIGARNQQGQCVFYPVFQNEHKNGILSITRTTHGHRYQHQAETMLERIMHATNYVGVATLELFATHTHFIANEIAPRVHNSGHVTIEASICSQFEQHIRCILNLPFGSTQTLPYAAMVNVLTNNPNLEPLLQIPNVHVHVYGKSPKHLRKMGHVTILTQTSEELETNINTVQNILQQG